MAWRYRADFDGLRTIAVYLVVCFHGGLPWVEGGFIGVDLFFVLSGFLIGSILLEELQERHQIDFARFYARRVRRLLPAAVAMVTLTCVVMVLVETSVRRHEFLGDARSALLYFANWHFIVEARAYFGGAIDQSPFLHFWSLAIEEQFYLLFPLLLWGLHKLRGRWRHAIWVGLVIGLVASLADQLIRGAGEATQATYAYYATDTRVYQLFAGALLALGWQHLRSSGPATPSKAAGSDGAGSRPGPLGTAGSRWQLPAWLGLVLLLLVSSTVVTVDPSRRGVLAAACSVLLIGGMALSEGGLLSRILARPTISYLGRISYGTYLWHWPVIIVVRRLLDTGPLAITALAVGVGTGLAALSYQVLEMPIRRGRWIAPYRLGTVTVGVSCSVLVALWLVPPIMNSHRVPVVAGPTHGAATTTSQPQSESQSESQADAPVPKGVHWQKYVKDKGPPDTYCMPEDLTSCIVHRGHSGLRVALVGDSHARVLAPALTDLAAKHDFTLSLSVIHACSWQLGVYRTTSSPSEIRTCKHARKALYDTVLDRMKVDVVILVQVHRDYGRWHKDLASTTDRTSGRKESLHQLNLRTIRQTLPKVRAHGRKVVVLDSMLTPLSFDPLSCLSGARKLSQCQVPVPIEKPRTDSYYNTLADTMTRIKTVDINPVMCPDHPICSPMIGKIPVWRDQVHFAPKALQAREDKIWKRFAATGFFTRR